MENFRMRIANMGKSAALLGAWVVLASAMSIVLNVGDAVDGNAPAIIRAVLGMFGLAAGAVFWNGQNFGTTGLRAILVWGVLQIPVYAWRPDGNPTEQLFDLVLGMSNQTVVNGSVANYSQIGINLVGVAVVIWASSCRERLDIWRRRSLAPAT
jgi:hypothetical protein